MATFAIKGHATRGKEVIEILEMLGGGINYYDYSADNDGLCFYINKRTNVIDFDWVNNCYDDEDVFVFTLEKFLEKYPYKVGDKVQHKGATSCGSVFEIKKMQWVNNDVEYTIKRLYYNNDYTTCTAKDLQPYKKETMEDKGTLVQIDLTKELCVADEVEVILGDYEFILKDGKTYFIKKKPQYPKTYEECCNALMGKTDFQDYSLLLTKLSTKINEANSISSEPPHITLINNFYKLLICRDAYWKIAGEQMGLGRLWEPDSKNIVHYIYYSIYDNEIQVSFGNLFDNEILAFPTAEMCDTFYENFKELIELCKELL